LDISSRESDEESSSGIDPYTDSPNQSLDESPTVTVESKWPEERTPEILKKEVEDAYINDYLLDSASQAWEQDAHPETGTVTFESGKDDL
jgi:hypothetical protein